MTYGERKLAALFGTKEGQGTSAAQVIYGMRKLDFSCHKRTWRLEQLRKVKPPVMLFVDHPATGPESHAVAYMGYRGRYEIWDPIPGQGKLLLTTQALGKRWHGRGVQCESDTHARVSTQAR